MHYKGKDIREYHLQDLGCKWPECECEVPDYAWSEHNRKDYCLTLKKITKEIEIR